MSPVNIGFYILFFSTRVIANILTCFRWVWAVYKRGILYSEEGVDAETVNKPPCFTCLLYQEVAGIYFSSWFRILSSADIRYIMSTMFRLLMIFLVALAFTVTLASAAGNGPCARLCSGETQVAWDMKYCMARCMKHFGVLMLYVRAALSLSSSSQQIYVLNSTQNMNSPKTVYNFLDFLIHNLAPCPPSEGEKDRERER
eukprot:sb/3470698/